MTKRLAIGGALVLALYALPALAAPADSASDAWTAIFAPAQPQPQEVAARPGSGFKSTCIANCWDGTTRTCTGATCSATNSACSSGQRGSCTGSDTGTLLCPACQGCSAFATCSPSGSVSCSGASGSTDCYSINKCYAYCDGVYHFCPSHGPCPL